MDKVRSLSAAIASLKDGMTIGIGGWGTRRKPMALVREILRSPLKDLHVISYGGPDVGMLCAAGKIRKLTYAFVSLDVIALEPYFRQARQTGSITTAEMDEGMLQWGLRAAAMRLPFLPTRVGLGSNVLLRNPEIRTVTSPYSDGETLVAMPALNIDLSLLHVNQADKRGNCLTLAPDPLFDEWFARAAEHTIVSCDQLVDEGSFNNPELARYMLFERTQVQQVVETPYGAHPTACVPRYGIDTPHLKAYCATAKEDNGWQGYYDKYIAAGEAAYLDIIGEKYISTLKPPVF